MSDAKSRWAAPWVRWNSFGTLWPQMVRDVSHRDRECARRRPSGNSRRRSDRVLRRARECGQSDGAALSASGPPHILVALPGEASRTLPLAETAPGHYEARIPADQRGLYRIVSGSSELDLPEAGFYHEAEETKPQAVNTALLGEISRITGGRMHPSIDQLLNEKGSLVRERTGFVAVLAHPCAGAQFPGGCAAKRIFRAPGRVAAAALSGSMATPAGMK